MMHLTDVQRRLLRVIENTTCFRFGRSNRGGAGVWEKLREKGAIDLEPAGGGLWKPTITPAGRKAVSGEEG